MSDFRDDLRSDIVVVVCAIVSLVLLALVR